MRKIAPFYVLTIIFLFGLILLTLFNQDRIPNWYFLLILYLIFIGIIFTLHFSIDRKKKRGVGSFIYYFSPTFLIIFIYQSFGELIHHLQPDIDPWLIKIDFLLFGVHPTVWMERWISPFLTELMSFFYGSYYFLPFILILTLYLKENREELNISISLLMLGYYISFIGYILLPAIGPRYTLSHLYSKPEGVLILVEI